MRGLRVLTGVVCLALAVTAGAGVPSEKKASEASNAFGFDFYRAVKRHEKAEQKGKNRLLSPISAFTALAMTSNGARNRTESAIRETIAAAGLSRDELNRSSQALLRTLNAAKEVKLALANSVWTRQGLGLLEPFSGAARNFYAAEARELDFTDPKAADVINAWAASKTNDKIRQVVKSPIREDFYLMNATYFKGSWRYPFNPTMTKAERFHGAGGSRDVAMLNGQIETPYVKRGSYEVVELPYGAMAEASLWLFVTDDLERLESTLDSREWKAIGDSLQDRKAVHRVTLSLPKFQFEYDADIKPSLSDMGMAIAFSPLADFSSMLRSSVSLTKASQKTYVNLDEKGTEAAAVTVIGGVTSVPVYPAVTVRADKPFLFAIRDNRTDTVLFLGAVVNP